MQAELTTEQKLDRANNQKREIENQRNFLDMLVRKFEDMLTAGSKPHGDGCYPYIPLEMPRFMKMISVAKMIWKSHHSMNNCYPKFLDVGCGIGTKVAVADSLGYNAYGLEIHAGYAEVARKLLAGRHLSNSCRIIEADARTFDRYSEFNVLYSYCPMCNPEQAKVILHRMFDEAADGTVFANCTFGPKRDFIHDLGQCIHIKWIDYCDERLAAMRRLVKESA